MYVLVHAFEQKIHNCVRCLSCLCSGAGDVLADSLLSLCSVEKLYIRGINPIPLLRVLSKNAEHCSVSTLGIAFSDHPEQQVRCVSIGPCTPSPPHHTLVHTLCAVSCTHMYSVVPSHMEPLANI